MIVQDSVEATCTLFDLTDVFAKGGDECIATSTNGFIHAACAFVENACERVLVISDKRLQRIHAFIEGAGKNFTVFVEVITHYSSTLIHQLSKHGLIASDDAVKRGRTFFQRAGVVCKARIEQCRVAFHRLAQCVRSLFQNCRMIVGNRVEGRCTGIDRIFDVARACSKRIGMAADDRGNAFRFTFQ